MCKTEGFNTGGCYTGTDGLKKTKRVHHGKSRVQGAASTPRAGDERAHEGAPSEPQIRPLRRGTTCLPCHSEEVQ